MGQINLTFLNMKRTLLTLFLFFILVTGFSQIEKKKLLIGGYASIGYYDKDFYLNMAPNGGYFFTDNICAGASIPMIYVYERIQWGIAPFGRYYFSPGKKQSLFASGSVGAIFNTYRDNIFFASLGIGNVWMLNEHVGFEAQIKGEANSESIDLFFQLGFQIYLDVKDLKFRLWAAE
jgi:hypothetical protein